MSREEAKNLMQELGFLDAFSWDLAPGLFEVRRGCRASALPTPPAPPPC